MEKKTVKLLKITTNLQENSLFLAPETEIISFL